MIILSLSSQNLYNFLAQPNSLEYLDLSATDTFLENVSYFRNLIKSKIKIIMMNDVIFN